MTDATNGRLPATPVAADTRGSVLVIDDRSENRMLIRYMFEDELNVFEAADGPEGLALATGVRPDCILLDVAMPGMSGFEVLERLGADPRTREIPVIILTATEDSLGAMERALLGGAVDYLTKPIDPKRVGVRVRGAIERARLLRELQTLRANFTSMLIHDLRAPLTVIGGHAELLESSLAAGGDGRAQRHVRRIQESCARMLRLIREILDVSKVEAGRLVIEPVSMDVARLVADVVDSFQAAAAKRGVQLSVSGTDHDRTLLADPARLEQVLMNLLSNALKFTSDGGRVSVEVEEADGQVTVAVRDTGPGVPPEERPLLFEPFSQTLSGRTASTQGSGLGLVICRHLVEAHGGRIWFDEVAAGSCFVFSLPKSAP